MIRLTKIYIFLLIFLFGITIPVTSARAQSCDANAACQQATSSCKPGTTNESTGRDKVMQGSSSTKMDINCLKEHSANSCFNSVPITGGTGNYNSIGKRSAGRNHYGTDIGASNTTSAKALAAADGEIALYKDRSEGSGRTTVINHPKKCGGWYHTVYRHLYIATKKSGTVKKDEEIGIVGGSNVTRSSCPNGGKFCQNKAQDGGASGCQHGGTTGCGYYDIHLHFELADGKFTGANTQAHTSTIMKPYCKDVSALCGQCGYEKECKCVSNCGGAFGGADTKQQVADEDAGDVSVQSTCNYASYLDSESCVFCNLFKIMFNTASEIAKLANEGLAQPSRTLVEIGFLIWIFFYLLKQVSSYGGASIGEMLKGLLFQGFRVAVVVLILNGAIYKVMDLTLNPVMKTGMNFVQNLSENSTCPKDKEYMQGINGYSEGGYESADIKGGLSVELGESIICSIKHLEDSTGMLMGMGKYSMCLAFNVHRWLHGLMPGLGYLSTGIFFWLAGLVLLLAFPWCLVDCILQLCIAAALVPCAIAAFAFKVTEKYIKIVWNFFMNAMFNFVFLALIVYIINSNFKEWVGISDSAPSPDTLFIEGSQAAKGLAWWGMTAVKVMATCFFCWTFFDEAGSMAKRFADSPGLGGSKGIGRMVGGTVASAAKNYGAKPAMHLAKRGAEAVGTGMNSLAGNWGRSKANQLKGWATSKLGGETIKDADGKTIGYRSSIRLLGHQFDRTVTKDENGVWTQMKSTHQRSATDKAFEKVLDANGNEMKDANGNTMYRARHRILGKTTGYEDMVATKDENGNLHYQTADGKSSFTMNANGEIVSYQTQYTRSILRPWAHEVSARQFGTKQTINDGISKTTNQFDEHGRQISSSTEFKNVTSNYLVNKDGTINTFAFNQMKNGALNAETAATHMVSTVMQSRGMELSEGFKDRQVQINEDGSFTIVQTNNDNSQQVINARMVDDQMIIDQQVTDSYGNITHSVSNGIQSKVEKFTAQREKPTKKGELGRLTGYNYDVRFRMSDHAHRNNPWRGPLTTKGTWGFDIDPKKAMAGFTKDDYVQHVAQVNLAAMQKKMTGMKFDREMRNKDSQVSQLNDLLHKKNMSQADVMNRAAEFNILAGLSSGPFGAGGAAITGGAAGAGGADIQIPMPSADTTPQRPSNEPNRPDNGSSRSSEQGLDELQKERNQASREERAERQRQEAEDRANRQQEQQRKQEEDQRRQQEQQDQQKKHEEDQRKREEDQRKQQEQQEQQKKQEEERKQQEQQKKQEEDQRKQQEQQDLQKKQEEEKQQKQTEQKENAERNERIKKNHENKGKLDEEKSRLEKERDGITDQYREIEKQLVAAKAAIDVAGITPEERQRAEATYQELLHQSKTLGESLAQNRKSSNEAIHDYNERVEKHNSDLEYKKLKK